MKRCGRRAATARTAAVGQRHMLGVFLDLLQPSPRQPALRPEDLSRRTRRRCHGYSRILSSAAASPLMLRDWPVRVFRDRRRDRSCSSFRFSSPCSSLPPFTSYPSRPLNIAGSGCRAPVVSKEGTLWFYSYRCREIFFFFF